MLKKIACGLVGCALSALTTGAWAVPVAELGDAGDLPASAQVLTNFATVTSVAGTIRTAADVDMFQFALAAPTTLSFMVAATSTIDSQLFLFNSAGAGLWANDDMGNSLDAQITAALTAGTYYLAISSWDTHPLNAGGLSIFGNASGVLLPPINSGAVTAWSGSGAIGSYSINVGVVPIPEPETWALLAAGLLAVVTRLRRTRERSSGRRLSHPGASTSI